jgi:hypothetical protein
MSGKVCVPTITENLLRLAPTYREYWGEQQAAFTRRLDVFSDAGCYVPRFFHAPDSQSQSVGVPPNGYVTYLLALPVGSFLLGFLHTTSSAPDSGSDSGAVPPTESGFSYQVTDLSIDHKLFSRPMPEAWFLNDLQTPAVIFPPYPFSSLAFTFPSFPRLLPVPYPVVGTGQFQVEFWNSLDSLNTDVQMTFLVLVPDGPNTNALRMSSK